MLGKENRLRKKHEFGKVTSEGNILQSDLFGLAYLKNNLDLTRFGVVVSTRVSKKAVSRNRIKRIFHSALRRCLDRIKKGFDVVFLVKRKAVGVNSNNLRIEIEEFLTKAGLLEKEIL